MDANRAPSRLDRRTSSARMMSNLRARGEMLLHLWRAFPPLKMHIREHGEMLVFLPSSMHIRHDWREASYLRD